MAKEESYSEEQPSNRNKSKIKTPIKTFHASKLKEIFEKRCSEAAKLS